MTRSFASTTSRSAVPLPWAIHAPEQARITGSSAVTSPLAGRDTSMRSPRRAWIYGSRFDTTRTSSPRRSLCRMVLSASGDQVTWLSSRARYSDSMSRISARRSLAMGRSSGSVAWGAVPAGRSRPSPRSRARTPSIHPRQLSCAITTVISETIAPSPMKKRNTYRFVSSLRRCTKLMSWTSTRSPSRDPYALSMTDDGHVQRPLAAP